MLLNDNPATMTNNELEKFYNEMVKFFRDFASCPAWEWNPDIYDQWHYFNDREALVYDELEKRGYELEMST